MGTVKMSAKDRLHENADYYNTRPVDTKQQELTDRILVPRLGDIERELLGLREAFDERMRAIFAEEMSTDSLGHTDDPSIRQSSNYPIGYCDTIRNGVWNSIEAALRRGPEPGLAALQHFIEEGGHFKKVYGILSGKYFQNGMQAGTLWVDIANNTIDACDPPLKICKLEDSTFRNIDDFSVFGDVLESYWNHRVFPQRIFPILTPIYPIMHLSPSGKLQIGPSSEAVVLNGVLGGYRSAEDLIFRSRFAHKRLPDNAVDFIKNIHNPETENSITTLTGDNSSIAQAFDLYRTLPPDTLYDTISLATDRVQEINAVLRWYFKY
ncbi:MAG: hypothetical protein NTX63_01010 [Candidatus Peregrinibacteria bacterium]|nr:hypothetical protein [Candidatus Peregrinibacteria bacterium]